MNTFIPIIFFTFFNCFSSVAECLTQGELWEKYQLIVKRNASPKTLLDLRQTYLKCHFQDSTYTYILEKIALNYANEKDFDKAIITITEAIKLNKSRMKDTKISDLESNYYVMAKIMDFKGDNQSALGNADLCIFWASKNLTPKPILSQSYALKAKIYNKIGDFDKAINQTQLGIIQAERRKDKAGMILCYTEMAKAYILQGKLPEGKKYLEKASEIIDNEKNQKSISPAYTYYWYALYYSKSKATYPQALIYFQKAQQYYVLEQNKSMFSTALIDLGFFNYNQGKYDDALINFQKAYQTMEKPFMKVIILDDIASCYAQKKDYSKAFEYFQKALSVAPIGFRSQTSFDNPSPNALRKADLKTYYLTTLQDKADTWLQYYQITKQKEHLTIALNTYLTADKLIDLMRFEHTGTNSKLYWRNKTHSLYEKAIETCYLLKDYEKAFYFFEKSKAVLLNDKLNELSAKQQLSPQDLAQEKEFQQQIAELTKKMSAEKESSQNYLNFQNKLSEIQTQQEQFIKGLETKNPVYFRYKYDTTLYNLGDIKKYLIKAKNGTKSGSTLIEYFVGDTAIYALKVTPEKTDFLKISSKEYSSNAKLFLKYCTDNQMINKNYQDFLQVSNQLYQQLFRDLNPLAGRLIIAQDGYFLPFEALSKSAQKSDYLLQNYAISYTYSVQFLLKNLGEKSFSIGDRFMGMSPVDFSRNLNQTSLTGSDISLKNVDENFYFGKTFYQKEATKKAFADNAGKYQIVHLYTHAQADSTDQEPMIYFADSVLKLSEISDLQRFKTQLLVLSACKTAVGRNAKGEGILSLSRGFATQGIPATLTTLWSVENQATYTLNELFYRYIAQGETKDIALQKAKLEFLKTQSGEKQLPTFWAAAVLVGDAEAISSGFQWWWIVGGIGVVVLFILYAVRR
jgi:CHAT domain-containing protein/tetratricopeptide (TPR) repeat protein